MRAMLMRCMGIAALVLAAAACGNESSLQGEHGQPDAGRHPVADAAVHAADAGTTHDIDASTTDLPDAQVAGLDAGAGCTTQELLGNGNFDKTTGLGSHKVITPWVQGAANVGPNAYLIADGVELP